MVAELVPCKRVLRVTRDSLCMMEKSREHQEQNLQREYQGKNQELTRMLLETQMELANKVGRATSAIFNIVLLRLRGSSDCITRRLRSCSV